MTATEPLAIVAALVAVMDDVRAVEKTEVNQQQGFRYRGVDAVVDAVGPALRAHRIVVLPMVEQLDMATVEVGKQRTTMTRATVRVRYRFIVDDGSSVDAIVVGEAFDAGDKAVAKSMSVCFRTLLLQVLALPTNQPDPDSVSYERAPSTESEFDALRDATKALSRPDAVVAWVKEVHITRGSLTPELIDEWQTRIELAQSLGDDRDEK